MLLFILGVICIFALILLLLCLVILLIQRHEIQKQLNILQKEEQESLFRKK